MKLVKINEKTGDCEVEFESDEEFIKFKKAAKEWAGRKRFSWKLGETFLIAAIELYIEENENALD